MSPERRALLERALPVAMLLVAAISVPVMALSPTGISRLNKLREERGRADEQVSHLSEEIRELRAEVERIRSDPRSVERAARDELGLVRQTEVVYQFDE